MTRRIVARMLVLLALVLSAGAPAFARPAESPRHAACDMPCCRPVAPTCCRPERAFASVCPCEVRAPEAPVPARTASVALPVVAVLPAPVPAVASPRVERVVPLRGGEVSPQRRERPPDRGRAPPLLLLSSFDLWF